MNIIKGGEFLIRDTEAATVFIPESWDETQQMIAATCADFLAKEVTPHLAQIDEQEPGLMEKLIEQSGKLGMLGIAVPEQYGGLGKDFTTAMLVTEKLGAGHSFSVAFAAHTGIGTLPILYYGNDVQKEKYLPNLVTGIWKGAYCLTEPEAGSDANAGKTRATLSDDGQYYLLNGQKMWITNAGFADIFTVFAKIDQDNNLSAFIVEKKFEGISLNPEEKKMGIKGSSTRQVFFNDCPVPTTNLLSERGNGFKIALNILNLGRIKLGGAALGACKQVITHSLQYAIVREQFGKPIAGYGAIRYKLAEQAIRTYATESIIYRTSDHIDKTAAALIAGGSDACTARLKAAEEFAIEAAMIKVHASETLDYVVDEGVQIYGGMGYSAEAPMERAYRDSRINRIFEGTNEINSMLVVDMMLKRALKGRLNLMEAAQHVAEELTGIPDFGEIREGLLAKESKYVSGFKKAVLLVAGAAVQQLTTQLAKEQEILLCLADMLIETYTAESLLLRVEKLALIKGTSAVHIQEVIAQVYIYNAADRIFASGKEALNSFATGDEKRMMMLGLKRFTKTEDINTTQLRRAIAGKLLDAGAYCF